MAGVLGLYDLTLPALFKNADRFSLKKKKTEHEVIIGICRIAKYSYGIGSRWKYDFCIIK